MKYKRYIFPVLMGVTMSVIMSLTNIGKIVFPSILIMMLMQAIVASIASLIFPAGLAGVKIVKKFLPGITYIPTLLVSSLLPAVYFTLILSITGFLRIRGFSDDFFMIYLKSLPKNIILGYATSILWNIVLDVALHKKGDSVK